MSRRVTLKQVAKRAGVSYQTVSRVVNHKPDVAPETRARVKKALRELDYRPRHKQHAPQKKQRVVSVVLPYRSDEFFADPHLLQIVHGIDREITAHNYYLLLATPRTSTGDAQGRTHEYRELSTGQWISGAIVECGRGTEDAHHFFAQGCPTVVVGYGDDSMLCAHPDDKGGAYTLTQHLLALGHRYIAVIDGPAQQAMQARWAGFTSAHRDAGLQYRESSRVAGDFTQESGYAAAATLMACDPPPTAIFAFNDRMALGAMRWLHEHGYRVPEDISLAGFDDIVSAAASDPPLTTVHIFSMELGQRAAALLLDMLNQHPHSTREHIYPTQLIVRGSTAIAPE